MPIPSDAAAQLRILHEFASDLLHTGTVDDVVWSVAKQAIGRLAFEDCVVYLLDADGTTLEQVASHGPKNPRPREILEPITIAVGEGIVGAVAATARPIRVADTSSDSRYIVDDAVRLSELAVPMLHDGQCIGVIDSEHPQRDFFTTDHETILVTIAALAAARIVHIRDRNLLQEGRNLFAQLVEQATDIIFRADVRGRFTYVNPVAVRETGYSEDELLSMSFLDLVDKADRVRVASVYREQFRDGIDSTYHEFRIRTKAGVQQWMGQNLQIFRERSRTVGFQAITRNITALREAQSAVSRSEAEKADILAHALDAIVTINARSEIIAFNPAAEAMFGHDRSYALGRDLSDVIIPDRYKEGHRAGMARLAAGEPSRLLGKRVELEAMHANGHEFPVELTLTSSEGSVGVTYTAFIRDITLDRKAKAALEAARKTAEESSRSKANFLAAMSHEIRTPLNAVVGISHLLGKTTLTADQQAYLDDIRRASSNLLGLINNVLDFQKIDAGFLELENVAFDLRDVVEEVAGRLRYEARPKGLDVRVSTIPDVPCWVMGDSLRVHQIVSNLVSNAVKFTDAGHVQITLTHDAAEGVGIEVADTGIGIAPDRLHRIFEPFAQASSDTTRRFGGTGLGLPIAKHLVDTMEGTLTVESEPGVGTRFRIRLPLRAADIQNRKPVVNSQFLELPDVSILVVEDNPVNQLVAREILASWGASVTVASGGREALTLLAGKSFQLVLMDIQMPEIDGYETTRAIRNDLGIPSHQLPIIALTASALLEQRNLALECGMDDFVMKPFDPVHLHARIMHALGERMRPVAEGTAVIDWHAFDAQYGALPELRDRVIGILSDQLPEYVTRLRAAADAADWEDVRFVAHKFLPSARMVGADRIAELCQQLEATIKNGLVREGDDDEVRHLATLLERMYHELQQSTIP